MCRRCSHGAVSPCRWQRARTPRHSEAVHWQLGAKSIICFTKASLFRQPRVVRKSIGACLLLLIVLSFVHAQDQESKLVDRLLRPDTTLRNDAQNKQFSADGASINKKATVGTFYLQKKSNSKSFTGTRDFSARQFNSQSFDGTRSASGISSQQAIGNSRPAYATRTARGPRDASQSDKKVASRSYAENRPFLEQGKSQKSLNRQNAPLTIEQVRELLNKNK
jgi:hypothetical protein